MDVDLVAMKAELEAAGFPCRIVDPNDPPPAHYPIALTRDDYKRHLLHLHDTTGMTAVEIGAKICRSWQWVGELLQEAKRERDFRRQTEMELKDRGNVATEADYFST